MKTADGDLRDRKWNYTWCDSNPSINGGYAGTANGGNNCKTTGRCGTEKYVADVNATQLCWLHRLAHAQGQGTGVDRGLRPGLLFVLCYKNSFPQPHSGTML